MIKKAVAELNNDQGSLRKVAEKYGIPKSSLSRYSKQDDSKFDHIEKFGSPFAHSQIFSMEEERLLAAYIIRASKLNYGLSKVEARKLAFNFATANNKRIPQSWSQKQIAGEDWIKGFFRRNKNLSIRKPEACSLSRGTSFNRKNVEDFFSN